MTLRRILLILVGVAALAVLVLWLAPTQELTDHLIGLFLTLPAWWPASLTFERFLIILVCVSVVLALIALGVAAAVGTSVKTKTTVRSRQNHEQQAVSQRELGLLKDQHQRQYEQLQRLGQALAERLSRRLIIQAMMEAASRVTSTPQANSLVSLWVWNYEKEVFRFELGHYCDASLFAQTDCAPTAPPWSTLLATKRPVLHQDWEALKGLVREEKASQLGAGGGILLVPLVIENAVLGALLIFCRTEIVSNYDAQRPFYDAVWGELTLGLAVALQGEVATLDRLTGVYNRDYFMRRLFEEIERANRFRLPISLLMIDIDNFKLVNDTLGHLQGDAVLKMIAKLIKKEVRAIDLVGRYGGEEFIIMLPETGYGEEAASTAGSLLVAERVRKTVYEEFRELQKPLNLTVSIGVTVRRVPEHQQMSANDMIRLADEQLYRAKTTGKNKVCVDLPDRPQPVSG